jgi:hypothetical protein
MKRYFIWYYRKLLSAVAYTKWLMFKQQPEYREGSRVMVRLSSALYGTEEVLCRISSVTYRFYSLTYDVIVLEDKGWLAFGTRTFVYPENILRTQESYK